jgi:hypothetical protein
MWQSLKIVGRERRGNQGKRGDHWESKKLCQIKIKIIRIKGPVHRKGKKLCQWKIEVILRRKSQVSGLSSKY